MRPQTKVKAGIGWTGSAVTLSSLLSSLTTSPTSQLPCYLSESIFVQHTSSSCDHFWRFSALDTDNSVRQAPSFSFHALHFILSHQLILVQLWQHCVGYQHWYTDWTHKTLLHYILDKCKALWGEPQEVKPPCMCTCLLWAKHSTNFPSPITQLCLRHWVLTAQCIV